MSADYMFGENGYPVTLTLYRNIPFDNTYKHHSFISSTFKYNGTMLGHSYTKQEDFINMKKLSSSAPYVASYIYPRTEKTGTFNFAYGNGIVTSLVLELEGVETSSNYLKVEQDTEGNINTWYYFITSIVQLNGATFRLSLELDVIMTFGNDFMRGMKNIPVFTRRKHCFRVDDKGNFGCIDYRNVETQFSSVKCNYALSKKKTKFVIANTTTAVNNQLQLIQWVYIAVSLPSNLTDAELKYLSYKHQDVQYPFGVICLPLVDKDISYQFVENGATVVQTYNINKLLSKLVGNGIYKGAKISPYPPFTDKSNIGLTITQSDFVINVGQNFTPQGQASRYVQMGNNTFSILTSTGGGIAPAFEGFMILVSEKDDTFSYEKLSVIDYILNEPSIDNDYKTNEFKLLLPPFKKYLLKTVFDNGLELRPELIYSNDVFSQSTPTSRKWTINTVTTCYPNDFVYYTFSPTQNEHNPYFNIALSGINNHTLPVGINALDYFNSTQSASYYQGKTAQAVGSLISTVGGIVSMGVGVTTQNPMLVTGGALAVAGGVKSGLDAGASVVAHEIDLSRTPDTLVINGSTYAHDLAVALYEDDYYVGMLPYLITLSCGIKIEETAYDHYYNYGYEVNRCCYFNSELTSNVYSDTELKSDNNLFTRSIFNYIKIEDDITNKINVDLPIIIKEKFNQIFNNGITLWTFFGFYSPWKNTTQTILATHNPQDYLFKEEHDNAEFYGQEWN